MQKNVKTALLITEGLIEAHIKNSKGIRDLVQDWDPQGIKGIGIAIAEVHEDVAKCLFVIKSLLEEKKSRRKIEKKSD